MDTTSGTFSGPSTAAALERAAEAFHAPPSDIEHETLLGSDDEGHVLIRAHVRAAPSPVLGFVSELLAAMGVEAEVRSAPTAEGLRIDVVGPAAVALSAVSPHVSPALTHIVRKVGEKLEPGRRHEVRILGEPEDRDTYLTQMALLAVERCRRFGRRVALPPMNPYERRLVHLAIRENSEMATESTGAGRDRRIVLIPFEETAAADDRS